MLKFLLLLIIFSQITFAETVYLSKNEEEKKILDSFRKQEIRVGVLKNDFTDEKVNGVSLNDIIEDMLKNYLQLNIKVEKGSWEEVYLHFKNGQTDILNVLTQTKERKKFVGFTKPLFGESLYIASKTNKINSREDIKNKVLYLTKESIYIQYLDLFLKENNLDIKKVFIEDNLPYRDYYFLESEHNILDIENKMKIGRLPDRAMAVSKKYEKLIPIINRALDERYKKIINKWIEDKKINLFQKNFYKSLTEEEKKYLKGLKSIGITYESSGVLSYYSIKSRQYEGLLPNLLSILFKGMDVLLVDKSIVDEEWKQKYTKFENGFIDVIPMSRDSEREKKHIFTKKLFDLNTYIVSNLRKNSDNKIGVIKDGIEEIVVRKYFLDDAVITYTDRESMLKDLKERKISSVAVFELNDLEKIKYTLELLEVVPINLALKKEDYILRDIINKAIDNVVDKKEILKKSEIQNKNYELEMMEKKSIKYNNILSILILVLFILTIQSYRIIKQQRKNKELLKDSLTGLLSRRVFEEFCLNKNYIFGITVVIDLNKFKVINDSYGHEVGDAVLVAFSNCLKSVFKRDYIFRISGDEFYIFAENKEFEKKLKEIETVFRNIPIIKRNNVGFSLGYFIKDKNIGMKDAFRYADMAMYDAKKSKIYKVKEANIDFINQTDRKERIKQYLKESIKDEFHPVFQPKYKVLTGELSGAETLARWESKELGFVSPVEFIPLAEEIGIVHRIDYKMAEETIKYLKSYLMRNSVLSDFRISFNFSAETFKRGDAVEKIESLLTKYEVSGEYVEVEITESMILADIEDILKKLNRLKSLGIKISIDDFTAGHSTVALLTTLPIDVVKFDRSLILILKGDSQKGEAIYLALTRMIKSLNLKIVAEGIEEESELEFLKRIEVDYVQGYLLGKPRRGL